MAPVLLDDSSVQVFSCPFESTRVGSDVRRDRALDGAAAKSQGRVKRRARGRGLSWVLPSATILIAPKEVRLELCHEAGIPLTHASRPLSLWFTRCGSPAVPSAPRPTSSF